MRAGGAGQGGVGSVARAVRGRWAAGASSKSETIFFLLVCHESVSYVEVSCGMICVSSMVVLSCGMICGGALGGPVVRAGGEGRGGEVSCGMICVTAMVVLSCGMICGGASGGPVVRAGGEGRGGGRDGTPSQWRRSGAGSDKALSASIPSACDCSAALAAMVGGG